MRLPLAEWSCLFSGGEAIEAERWKANLAQAARSSSGLSGDCQPRSAQAFEESLPIVRSRERPNQALIARCHSGHAIQQLIQRRARGHVIAQMSMGSSQNRVGVGKNAICFIGKFSELDCLFVPPGQQRGPAFADMPDDHKQTSRTEADRLFQVPQ